MPQIQTPESKGTRFLILIASAIAGLSLGWLVNCYELLAFMGIGFETHGAVSAVILVASLPTLIILWWFRTHDTRQQIKNSLEAISVSLLDMYIKMLSAEKKEERIIGLLALVNLKKKGFFVERIDFTTQQNLRLEEANLDNKDLSGMNLSNARFERTRLTEANLSNVNFSDANLISAKLQGANLQGAVLQGAYLINTNLTSAKLQGANLQGAVLQGANLINTNLTSAKLQGANLQGADLQGANLKGAILQGANLRRAILRDQRLEKVILVAAEYNKETKFPEGFNPEGAGMKLVG